MKQQATDVTDATLGASCLWLGTRTGAGVTATLTASFWPQPMAPWTTGLLHSPPVPHFKALQTLPLEFLKCAGL